MSGVGSGCSWLKREASDVIHRGPYGDVPQRRYPSHDGRSEYLGVVLL